MYRKNIVHRPFQFVERVVKKVIIEKRKYRAEKGDYDARCYWEDRFSKYGFSLKGVGHEGFSEDENLRMYKDAENVLVEILRNERLNLEDIRVLEIGCGTGFYTKVLNKLQVRKCVCIDITDVLFDELRKEFPEYMFIKKDITDGAIVGPFDLILMIDVIQHITKKRKFDNAMKTIKGALSSHGIFIVSPIHKRSRRQLFYTRSWSLDDINNIFGEYDLESLIPFRRHKLLIIRN